MTNTVRNLARIAAASNGRLEIVHVATPKTARTRTATPAAAAVASKAAAPRPRGVVVPVVVSIDGAPEAVGSHLISTHAQRGIFANTVLATLVAFAGEFASVAFTDIQTITPGLCMALGTATNDNGDEFAVAVMFGTPDTFEPAEHLTVGDTLAGGMPVEEAAAIAKASQAASTPKPAPVATPQIAPLAGMSPIGARPTKAPVSNDDHAARKLASAALAESADVVLTVEVVGHGTYAATRHASQSLGGFLATAVSPRVADMLGGKRCSVETASGLGDNGAARARLMVDGKTSVVVNISRAPIGTVPAPDGSVLPAFVTRAGRSIDAIAASAGLAPRPVSALDKALAARDALNAPVAAPGVASKAGSPQAAREIAARGKLALRAAQPRQTARVTEMYAQAATGTLPALPDFSAPTHARYVKPLAEVEAAVKAGNVAWLKAHTMQPLSSSRVMLCRYRDLAIVALEARAAQAATKA